MSVIAPFTNLAHDPNACRICKRPVTVHVRFAEAAGTLDTLEGPATTRPAPRC